ncbi:hypothetical protein EDB80DRAFT_220113 [Ilyonectria destructans]|nr:hypothetical protein EDB80DRAFT_220113 [Ilyonectria destructans]
MVFAPSGPTVLAVSFTLIGIAAFVIAARIYLRLKIQRRRLQASDLLMMAAWCAAVSTASFDVFFYVNGILRADINYTLVNYDADAETFEYILRVMWGGVIPFFSTFYLCKASLLAVYLQLFPVFMVKRRIALWATIAYCAIAYVVSISLVLFLCYPIDRNWSVTKPERLCPGTVPATIFQISWSLNFFGSILLFALPFTIIYNLKMARRMKIALYSVFLLGLVDMAFSLTRFLTIQLGNEGDFRAITLIELWSALDAYGSLIIACLPSLRPYLRKNPAGSYDENDNKSPHPSRSTLARRTGQNGFEEIDETSYPRSTDDITSGPVRRRDSNSPDIIAHSTWTFDKKSNRSDVELVNINARTPVREQAHV